MKLLTFSFGDLMTNTYFCIDENTKECFIIDPGTDGEAVYKKASERDLGITHIILTHGHFDHALGVKSLKEKTGATVAIGAKDAELLTDKIKNSACIFYPGDFEYPSVEPDRLLFEGDTLTLGSDVFTVIETPGHTKGGICLDTGELLFTGDTLFASGFGRTDLYGGDLGELLNSLSVISKISGERKVCPGHGNLSTLSRQRSCIEDIIYNYGIMPG